MTDAQNIGTLSYPLWIKIVTESRKFRVGMCVGSTLPLSGMPLKKSVWFNLWCYLFSRNQKRYTQSCFYQECLSLLHWHIRVPTLNWCFRRNAHCLEKRSIQGRASVQQWICHLSGIPVLAWQHYMSLDQHLCSMSGRRKAGLFRMVQKHTNEWGSWLAGSWWF